MNVKASEKFFAENISFDESVIENLRKSVNRWRAFSFVGWSVGTIATVAAASLVTLHEFVPVVATVDRLTGTVAVTVGKERFDPADPANERMMTADLIRYTRAREGFTRGEAESNYATVFLMSDPGLRGQWDNEYRSERNPNALINRLGVRDQIKISNISVTFLPTDSPKNRVAQVRYDKERRIGAGEPTMQRFVSTVTFNYDVGAIPTTVEGISANFNGFQALNYRIDKQTEELRIPPADAGPPPGVYRTASTAPGAVAGSKK